jgi:hypothetical protein
MVAGKKFYNRPNKERMVGAWSRYGWSARIATVNSLLIVALIKYPTLWQVPK